MAGLRPTAEIQNQKTIRKNLIYLERTIMAVFKASTFLVVRSMSYYKSLSPHNSELLTKKSEFSMD